jgi:hypothetical protein
MLSADSLPRGLKGRARQSHGEQNDEPRRESVTGGFARRSNGQQSRRTYYSAADKTPLLSHAPFEHNGSYFVTFELERSAPILARSASEGHALHAKRP